MRALVLAGHGSHISPHTAGIVWEYVDQLRQWGAADEVTACFWKEPPAFARVLDTLRATAITVVPVFTAQGYFSQTIIPVEMGLAGSMTERDGRCIRYAPTLGEHAGLGDILWERVLEVLRASQLAPESVAVAVIGHGTPRNRRSQDTARAAADALRAEELVAEVVAVYLEDEPAIPSVYESTRTPYVIAVPFFLAPGSHVTRDVPAALGLAPEQATGVVRGRQVITTPPLGTAADVGRMLLDLARAAGHPVPDSLPEPANGDPWVGFPQVGHTELSAAVAAAGELRFGELCLTPSEVRPLHNSGDLQPLTSPAEVRDRVRGRPFRPLPTARDLPGGWRVPLNAVDQVPAVVETIYPGTVAAWALHQCRALVPTALAEVVARQTGDYRALANLSPAAVDRVCAAVCETCVRHPLWQRDTAPEHALPCAEPCNFWLSTAKDQPS